MYSKQSIFGIKMTISFLKLKRKEYFGPFKQSSLRQIWRPNWFSCFHSDQEMEDSPFRKICGSSYLGNLEEDLSRSQYNNYTDTQSNPAGLQGIPMNALAKKCGTAGLIAGAKHRVWL